VVNPLSSIDIAQAVQEILW